MDIVIDTLKPEDWSAVAEIYQQGIDTRNATFETTVPSWEEWNAKHRPDCRFVAKYDDTILGWVVLSPVSSRCVYEGVAEVSVYVATEAYGRGIGSKLMAALVEASENAGIWMLQAGIFVENAGSLALHKKYGFREVGYREKLGAMDGVWRNVALLERRSKIVGV